MKIKDILEDYSIHPNIPVKHLANDIEKVIGQFKDSLKVGICSPSQLIYSYCNYFDDIKKSFIRCVLNKEKSKSAHPTNPVEGCADANPKTMLPNDT